MPVELHQPQAHGRRVPVEHHRRVRADPRARHEPLQHGSAHGAVAGILQVRVDVPQHGTVDVPVVIGGRADVDFDHAETGVVEVSGQPARVDQHPTAETWPWPGRSLLCCRLHLNLPHSGCLRGQFYDGAIAITLPRRWRNLGVRGPYRSRPTAVSLNMTALPDRLVRARPLAHLRVSPRGRYAPDDPGQADARAEPDDLRVTTDAYSTIPNRTESAIR